VLVDRDSHGNHAKHCFSSHDKIAPQLSGERNERRAKHHCGRFASLNREPRDAKIIFRGGLNFYRLKQRGEDLIQVEFNEPVSDALTYCFKHHK